MPAPTFFLLIVVIYGHTHRNSMHTRTAAMGALEPALPNPRRDLANIVPALLAEDQVQAATLSPTHTLILMGMHCTLTAPDCIHRVSLVLQDVPDSHYSPESHRHSTPSSARASMPLRIGPMLFNHVQSAYTMQSIGGRGGESPT